MSCIKRLDPAFRTRFATIPAELPPERDPGVIDVNEETFPDLDTIRAVDEVIKARAHIREPGREPRS